MAESALAAMPDWGTTLAAALIGAERAPPQPLEGAMAGLAASGDAGGDLLVRIGAVGAYHLAGAGLAADSLTAIEPFTPVGPECPPLAAARLVTLLGSGASMAGMINEWCDVAAAKGCRLPPELLPLLEDFRGTATQPAATAAIAGAEIDWLRRVCGEAPATEAVEGDAPQTDDASETEDAETAAPAPVMASATSDDWMQGNLQARRAAFYGFRQRDPDGSRAALEAVFKAEKADAREQFLNTLEVGLTPADEPFLEACLDDRAGGVRRVAQRLLPKLPGSRFMERMAARVAAALRIEEKRHMLVAKKHELVVTLLEEAPDLVRDGIAPSTYDWKKRGKKAQLLAQILERAPLKAFAAHPPRIWIETALKSEWSEPILDGLIAALWRERDPAWRDALIATLSEANAGKLSNVKANENIRNALARAIAILPAAEWERSVSAMLKTPGIELALQTMSFGPDHYSAAFSATLFDWLAFRMRGGPESTGPLRRGNLFTPLGYRADPSDDSEAASAAIVSRLPEDCDNYLRHQLSHMAETLSLRATIRREFATT